MSAWQDISTAPITNEDTGRFGETILVWDGSYVSVAKRDKRGNFFDLESVDRDGDWNQIFPPPTHWQPLPGGPTPEPHHD